jgi:hypothetical protein
MNCENKVSYFVERGYDYSEVFVKCGNTNPRGGRAICEKCSSNPDEMRFIRQQEENIKADNDALRSAGYGEM